MGSFSKVNNMSGRLLIATPFVDEESCFAKSVLLVLSDNEEGSLGVIVNRVITSVNSNALYKSLDIDLDVFYDSPIHFGGPVELEKGLILHSNDYKNGNSILELDNNLVLSSNIEILKDIASGKGPRDNLLALGYSGWGPGQLAAEIKSNNWIDTSFSYDLIFNDNHQDKWYNAIRSLGIEPHNYSHSYGRA